jgi:hypothetical protein
MSQRYIKMASCINDYAIPVLDFRDQTQLSKKYDRRSKKKQ